MPATLFHPALARLTRYQAVARFRMALRRFATPRRLVLSALAVVLSFVWLSQTVAGILFRPAADPARLAIWIPASFAAYVCWNTIKAFCRKPAEPFEWTAAERELLLGAPLRRSDVVKFRLGSIVSAASLKALCFAVVMMPDLRFWPLAWVGMLAALTLIDLLRMTAEVVAWGLTPTQRFWTRCAMVAIAAGAGLSALLSAYFLPPLADSWPAPFGFVLAAGNALLDLRLTLPGQAVFIPFQAVAQSILESSSWIRALLYLMGSLGGTALVARLLIAIDAWVIQARRRREDGRYTALNESQQRMKSAGSVTASGPVRVPPAFHGAYSLGWRQLKGMYHYRHSLAFSLLLPAVLSLLPLCSDAGDFDRTMHIICSLVFYSFLLLPSALRFDFRRDIERMAVVKALPIGPAWTALGQLACPVLVCTLFQVAVLLIAMVCRPYSPTLLLFGVILLIPVNALIFCLENLIFMMFPYRLNQEGISVFLRSILTFTAKGLICLAALAAVLTLAVGAAEIANRITIGTHRGRLIVIFGFALWVSLSACVIGTFALLTRVYRRFDPSQDVPTCS